MTRLKVCINKECGAEHVNRGDHCDDCLIDGKRSKDTLHRKFDRDGNDAL